MPSQTKVSQGRRSSEYSCCKVRETFQPDRGPAWKDWRPYQDLDPLMAEGFCSLRRPKRRRNEDEARTANDALHFYTKEDLDVIYERYLAQQTLLHGSDLCDGLQDLRDGSGGDREPTDSRGATTDHHHPTSPSTGR